jgi:alpha-galactosidase
MMKTTFDTNDSWDSMLNNLHSTINLPTYQSAKYFNMPDMLSVGQGRQTQPQYRAQMLLWSVMGAPLILGAVREPLPVPHLRDHCDWRVFLLSPLWQDIRKLDAFTLKLVTAPEVLAVNADADCVQGSLLRSRGSYEIWCVIASLILHARYTAPRRSMHTGSTLDLVVA